LSVGAWLAKANENPFLNNLGTSKIFLKLDGWLKYFAERKCNC